MVTFAEPFEAWVQRQHGYPARRATLAGVHALGLEPRRSMLGDETVVLRVVPVIVLNLDTVEWRTVNDTAKGQGLFALVRYLRGSA